MQITAVEISDQKLWDGVPIKSKRSGIVRTIKVYPADMTISQAVTAGLFNPNENWDFETVMMNKHLFELVPDPESVAWDEAHKND